jgi:hypothetical protein
MARFDAAVGRYIYLPINGIEYRVYCEETGTGIPLLLQHTAGADGRQWRHLLEDPDVQQHFHCSSTTCHITSNYGAQWRRIRRDVQRPDRMSTISSVLNGELWAM